MKSLNEILAEEKKEEIISIVQRFGFSADVKIISEPVKKDSLITLTLMVNKVAETSISWDNRVLLAVKLSKELGCQVDVLVLQNIPKINRFGLIEKSASLSDEGRICDLFGVTSISQILLNDTEKPHPTVLQNAEEYLGALVGGEKKLSAAENLSKHAVVCEADLKKRKVDSSAESDSPKSGSTESPQKSNGPGSKK